MSTNSVRRLACQRVFNYITYSKDQLNTQQFFSKVIFTISSFYLIAAPVTVRLDFEHSLRKDNVCTKTRDGMYEVCQLLLIEQTWMKCNEPIVITCTTVSDPELSSQLRISVEQLHHLLLSRINPKHYSATLRGGYKSPKKVSYALSVSELQI